MTIEIHRARTEDTDHALKKFFKNMLQRFHDQHNELFLGSNIQDIMKKLASSGRRMTDVII